MSGCYPSEQIKDCNHGNDNSGQCHMCGIESILNYASLKNRIEALHCNKLQQIDLNRKAEERIKKLENFNQYDTELISNQIKKINELEIKFANDIDSVREGLLQTRLQFIDQLGNDKKPHRCPICEGQGYWHKVENGIACGGRCQTCEGKGIVWG